LCLIFFFFIFFLFEITFLNSLNILRFTLICETMLALDTPMKN